METRPEGKLGLSINTLMREVLIEHGIPHLEANAIVNRFASAFDGLTGTEWLEVNGTTEWRLTFDCRPEHIPMSEDKRKKLGVPIGCPCGVNHAHKTAKPRKGRPPKAKTDDR